MRRVIIISIIILFLILLYNYKYNLQFKVWLINIILVSRGLVTTNCKWFGISDIVLGNDDYNPNGDMNQDGIINVLDIVSLVSIILGDYIIYQN